MKEIDKDYTKEIVCPWCGYEHGDSWEYQEDEDEMECQGCDKKFSMTIHHEITYSTEKIRCEGKCQYVLKERVYGDNPYHYKNKNWTIWICNICDHEDIKTGPITGEPYIIQRESEN